MRHARFFDWLDEVTDGPVGRVVKTVLATLLLLSLAGGVVSLVRSYRAEQAAANARYQQQLRP